MKYNDLFLSDTNEVRYMCVLIKLKLGNSTGFKKYWNMYYFKSVYFNI